jgi:AcrR family transcriptional regulator
MAAFWLPRILTREQAVEIRVLRRSGLGLRAIARELGCSRTTVKRYVRDEAAARYGPRQPRPTKLDAHKAYLLERIVAARPRWIRAVVLLREIRERGYAGGVTQLKAFINPLKQVRLDPVVRFETAPGEQMQADFTVVRRGRDPLLAFVATLGYSRASCVRFTRGEDAARPTAPRTSCYSARQAWAHAYRHSTRIPRRHGGHQDAFHHGGRPHVATRDCTQSGRLKEYFNRAVIGPRLGRRVLLAAGKPSMWLTERPPDGGS